MFGGGKEGSSLPCRRKDDSRKTVFHKLVRTLYPMENWPIKTKRRKGIGIVRKRRGSSE